MQSVFYLFPLHDTLKDEQRIFGDLRLNANVCESRDAVCIEWK